MFPNLGTFHCSAPEVGSIHVTDRLACNHGHFTFTSIASSFE
jgi:hypothetical protein